MIRWDENNDVYVCHNISALCDDGYCVDGIFYEYYEMGSDLFWRMVNCIEGEFIKRVKRKKAQLSNIATFAFCDDEYVYEFIVDEANYIYTVNCFSGSLDFVPAPLSVMHYLTRALEKAKYKNICIR